MDLLEIQERAKSFRFVGGQKQIVDDLINLCGHLEDEIDDLRDEVRGLEDRVCNLRSDLSEIEGKYEDYPEIVTLDDEMKLELICKTWDKFTVYDLEILLGEP